MNFCGQQFVVDRSAKYDSTEYKTASMQVAYEFTNKKENILVLYIEFYKKIIK